MLIHQRNHMGDSWYYVHEDLIHCFYLTSPDTIERHTAWDIGHATSSDLVNWTIHDLVLQKGAPGSYDGNCPATGSVIRFQDRYWLAYTGNWNGPVPTAALAVSDDLYRWEKCAWNPVTQIDPRYYETIGTAPRAWPHWRDPFLFEHEGYIYHYVSARLNTGESATRGTLGMARTQDMRTWEILPPPEVEPVVGELEVPQVHKWENLYYLAFSTLPEVISDKLFACFPKEDFTLSGYSMVGPSLFGPFKMHGNGRILPLDYAVQPYAIQIVIWQEKPYLLGTVWNDEQDFICDPIPLQFTDVGVKARL
jgi:beta-fructofuranosidase